MNVTANFERKLPLFRFTKCNWIFVDSVDIFEAVRFGHELPALKERVKAPSEFNLFFFSYTLYIQPNSRYVSVKRSHLQDRYYTKLVQSYTWRGPCNDSIRDTAEGEHRATILSEVHHVSCRERYARLVEQFTPVNVNIILLRNSKHLVRSYKLPSMSCTPVPFGDVLLWGTDFGVSILCNQHKEIHSLYSDGKFAIHCNQHLVFGSNVVQDITTLLAHITLTHSLLACCSSIITSPWDAVHPSYAYSDCVVNPAASCTLVRLTEISDCLRPK
jgi:hypothetical protein